MLGRLLQLCFTYCVGLHGLSTLKRAAAENAMLSCLFAEPLGRDSMDISARLKRLKDSECYMDRGGEAWLLLDCVMTCYALRPSIQLQKASKSDAFEVILLGLVDLAPRCVSDLALAEVLVFTESTSPKDVCFDALGLLFIFHLHEATCPRPFSGPARRMVASPSCP